MTDEISMYEVFDEVERTEDLVSKGAPTRNQEWVMMNDEQLLDHEESFLNEGGVHVEIANKEKLKREGLSKNTNSIMNEEWTTIIQRIVDEELIMDYDEFVDAEVPAEEEARNIILNQEYLNDQPL